MREEYICMSAREHTRGMRRHRQTSTLHTMCVYRNLTTARIFYAFIRVQASVKCGDKIYTRKKARILKVKHFLFCICANV